MNPHESWDWHSAWPAPAKINLFLHVVGRRNDGYHLLQTVFRFLDLADTLHFTARDDGSIVRSHALAGVSAEQDLCVRAAQLLRATCGIRRGVDIRLHKHLPMGGGLGGGSSDAATTLIALNHLWRCGLSREELEALGVQLGADVAIFIHGHSAFAEGIGERFVDVAPAPAWYVVVIPAVAVPTARIFAAPELRRDTAAIGAGQWHDGFGHNDLEAVACAHYPEVAQTLAHLRLNHEARMSGSGACCFVAFPDRAQAQAALTNLAARPAQWRAVLAQGIDRHPLHSVGIDPTKP